MPPVDQWRSRWLSVSRWWRRSRPPGRSVSRSVLLPWEERTLDSPPDTLRPLTGWFAAVGLVAALLALVRGGYDLVLLPAAVPGWGCWLRCLVRAR